MARFARECMVKFTEMTQKLEITLGPDTGELQMRAGLHSGQVTVRMAGLFSWCICLNFRWSNHRRRRSPISDLLSSFNYLAISQAGGKSCGVQMASSVSLVLPSLIAHLSALSSCCTFLQSSAVSAAASNYLEIP